MFHFGPNPKLFKRIGLKLKYPTNHKDQKCYQMLVTQTNFKLEKLLHNKPINLGTHLSFTHKHKPDQIVRGVVKGSDVSGDDGRCGVRGGRSS